MNTKWEEVHHHDINNFDRDGRSSESISLRKDGSFSSHTRHLLESGRSETQYLDAKGNIRTRHVTIRDGQARVLERFTMDGDRLREKETFQYDQQGWPQGEREVDGEGALRNRSEYRFGPGTRSERLEYDPEGRVQRRDVWVPDRDNGMMYFEQYEGDALMVRSSYPYPWPEGRKYRVVSTSRNPDGTFDDSITWYEDHRILEKTVTRHGEPTRSVQYVHCSGCPRPGRTAWSYNEHFDETERQYSDPDGKLVDRKTTTYEYDDANNWGRRVESVVNARGEALEVTVTIRSITYYSEQELAQPSAP